MQKRFEADAAQLILKGQIVFHGLLVVICPVPYQRPGLYTDRVQNCYCVNLPNDRREMWDCWTREALELLYERVVCYK